MPHVCPWWLAYTFDNALRRRLHDPERMLAPHVRGGMTVLDVGCGMGFFSIALARLVGAHGTVIAADLQQQMLDVTTRRAESAGVVSRVRPHLCTADRIGIKGSVDFVLAFWMVHEVPDLGRFMSELHSLTRPDGCLLVAEPRMHVSRGAFAEAVATACSAGFAAASGDAPRVRLSHAELFRRPDGP